MPGIERRRGWHANNAAFGRYIRSEVARMPAVAVATKIARRANAVAPAQNPAEHREKAGKEPRERLKGSYRVRRPKSPLVVGKRHPNARSYAEVESTSPTAYWQEVGDSKGRSHPLRTAAAPYHNPKGAR